MLGVGQARAQGELEVEEVEPQVRRLRKKIYHNY